MPARRRKQSNAMLYTLITFVGLFIVATTIAVIYYVEAEDKRTRLEETENKINDLADSREISALGSIVGTRASRKTWLGTMVERLDGTTSMIVGGVPETTSAEAKVNDARIKKENALKAAQEFITIPDPNTTGLVKIISDLVAELNKTLEANKALQTDLDNQIAEFETTKKAYADKEQILEEEKNKLQALVTKMEADYADLQTRLQQTTTEQVDHYKQQLDQARADLKTLEGTLLKTRAELKMTQDIMKRAQEEIRNIMPAPDHEVLAHRADGKIILIDNKAQVVHLNIGSDQHVYRGLTFTVYDRSGAIPKDGKGKAEIEVFDVGDTYCAARITKSNPKEPILLGDIAANLIWNSDKTNVFVIAGDFDLDGDGNIDENATWRIKSLIEKWGGKVVDNISIDTDFLLLGDQPEVPEQQPTLEQQELDPGALQRYEARLQQLNQYNQLQSQAQSLWIPIFKYERFLYFIGYKGQISKAGAI
jgi:predicted  nucleic acid-binding Zn-ribbon protein